MHCCLLITKQFFLLLKCFYNQLLEDLKHGNKASPVFTHHIRQVNHVWGATDIPYEKTEPNQLVVDYIASMTDDYFIELHQLLFPTSPLTLQYHGYFEDIQ